MKHAIYLDNYTMMNAGYAKQVFSDKTICESISYLSMMLNVKIVPDGVYQSQWHKFTHHWDQMNKAISNNTDREIKSCFALLHYQISVFGIYIERLMNQRWKLSSDNIDKEECTLKEIVTYFELWIEERKQMKEREKTNESDVDKYCISLITYNNMKTLVSGFIQYARCIVECHQASIYIPALHSNQSNLEGLFSRIRFMGKDKTHLYAGGILQQNVFNQISSIKKLRGNSSYPVNNISLEMNVDKKRNRDLFLCECYEKEIRGNDKQYQLDSE